MQRVAAATRQEAAARRKIAVFIPHDSRDLLCKGGLRYTERNSAPGAQAERRGGAGPAGGLLGGKDPSGRFFPSSLPIGRSVRPPSTCSLSHPTIPPLRPCSGAAVHSRVGFSPSPSPTGHTTCRLPPYSTCSNEPWPE